MSLKIGVDGGGTKTELILVESSGALVARHTAPGCNPSHVGAEMARIILSEALVNLRDGREISHTQLYMAGSPAFWQETAAVLTGFGRVTTAPDSVPVVELATRGKPGLVMHAGTGSFIAARTPDGAIHYAGGLGWKIGDPGSAFDLGRRGIAHGLLELQGWARATALSAALQAHLGLNDAISLTRYLYNEVAANGEIARFAPRVIELAQTGCVPAQAALAATLSDMVEQARLVSSRLFSGPAVPCSVSGALLNSPPAVAALRLLAETHDWNVEYFFLTEAPIEGVRRLLLAAR
ncbi:MAG TPA: BadF/BadG/BcrA/BcrD ATPase family protein [Candidatus Didemnitutus sp.]|jgi:N-acetylglucosamine kinase-like BadF-type ATPase